MRRRSANLEMGLPPRNYVPGYVPGRELIEPANGLGTLVRPALLEEHRNQPRNGWSLLAKRRPYRGLRLSCAPLASSPERLTAQPRRDVHLNRQCDTSAAAISWSAA